MKCIGTLQQWRWHILHSMKKNLKKIGFIGQGWVGKNYADYFQEQGFLVVRYSLDKKYIGNADKIKDCDIVFIAVPTPTTPRGFDDKNLRQSMNRVGRGKIAVIKSTVLPGTTESIQREYKGIFVFHSPEFLRRNSARHDIEYPDRNIIGLPINDKKYQKRVKDILHILPKAPFHLICSSKEAELIKYASNSFLYTKVVFANIFYDISLQLKCNFNIVKNGLAADVRIGKSHLEIVDEKGRGAGGDCLAKDFSAMVKFYKKEFGRTLDFNVLKSIESKNIELLIKSKKDIPLLLSIYGKNIISKGKKK